MTRILFVCHGNICRSTMAQSVMAYLVKKAGLPHVLIDSAGTSDEEEGNPVHGGTRRKLRDMGIPCIPHDARQISTADAQRFDYIIAMDDRNLRNLKRMLPSQTQGKIMKLLDLTESPRDIADPWYTGNFEDTFSDILEGCQALCTRLRTQGHLLPL